MLSVTLVHRARRSPRGYEMRDGAARLSSRRRCLGIAHTSCSIEDYLLLPLQQTPIPSARSIAYPSGPPAVFPEIQRHHFGVSLNQSAVSRFWEGAEVLAIAVGHQPHFSAQQQNIRRRSAVDYVISLVLDREGRIRGTDACCCGRGDKPHCRRFNEQGCSGCSVGRPANRRSLGAVVERVPNESRPNR